MAIFCLTLLTNKNWTFVDKNPFSILKKRRGEEWSVGGSIVDHKGTLKATLKAKMIDKILVVCICVRIVFTKQDSYVLFIKIICVLHFHWICVSLFSLSNISMLDTWRENDDKRRDMDNNMLEMPKKQKQKKAWKEDDAKDVDLMLWYYMQYVKEDHPLSPPLLPLLSTLKPSGSTHTHCVHLYKCLLHPK